jgi:hypothetical protein
LVGTNRWIISKRRAMCDDILAVAAKMFAFNAFGAAKTPGARRRGAAFVAGERHAGQ